MAFALAFHSKYPNIVWDTVHVFLFPDLYPAACYEATLLTRQGEAVFGGGTLTSFTGISLLLGRQNPTPLESWNKTASQIEVWEVF